MDSIQVTINGNIISGTAGEIARILGAISAPIVENSPAQQQPEPETPDNSSFNEFLFNYLRPTFGYDNSTEIVQSLNSCLQGINTCPDFRKFRAMYRKAGTLQQRKLIRTVSAVYRLKFCTHFTDEYKATLRSNIRDHTECPHCGELAHRFKIRLHQEGLI